MNNILVLYSFINKQTVRHQIPVKQQTTNFDGFFSHVSIVPPNLILGQKC